MEKHKDLISFDNICSYYSVESEFLSALQQMDLIEVVQIHENRYIHDDELTKLEKYIRMNKDLDINTEGIQVITGLLEQIRSLQRELDRLKSLVNWYE